MHGIPTSVVAGAASSIAVVLTRVIQRIEKNLRGIGLQLVTQMSSSLGAHEALVAQISPLLHRGQKITAVKVVRETMGCSLVAAKNCVDDLARQINS